MKNFIFFLVCILSIANSQSVIPQKNGFDNNIILDQIQNGDRSFALGKRNNQEMINNIILSPDGTMLATIGEDSTIVIWNIKDSSIVWKFTGHTDKVNSIAFSPDGTMLISGSNDRSIRLWNLKTGNLIRSIEDSSMVYSVAFYPNGTKIAYSGCKVKVRSIDGNLLKTFSFKNYYGQIYYPSIFSIAISQDGTRMAAALGDATLSIIDLQKDTLLFNRYFNSIGPSFSNIYMSRLIFSPDGKWIVGTIKDFFNIEKSDLFQFELESCICWTSSYRNYISFDISKDGKIIAFGLKDRIELFNFNSSYYYKSEGTIPIDSGSSTSLCFTKDGKSIITGGNGWKILSLLNLPTQITINPTGLSFSATKSGPLPKPQTFNIAKIGFKEMNWNITADVSWLEVSPTSGKDEGTVNVKIITKEMDPRSYYGKITITSPEVINSPQKIYVNYNIFPNYSLKQNSPNPFDIYTNISYSITEQTHVNLTIYNSLGQEVEKLVDGVPHPGIYSIRWWPRNLPSGVYYYRLKTEYFTDVKKMLYFKKDSHFPYPGPWK